MAEGNQCDTCNNLVYDDELEEYVCDMDMDEEIEYSLVSTNEANPMLGRISDRSPIGSAMIGLVAGDEFTVDSPGGQLKFKILSIERSKGNN